MAAAVLVCLLVAVAASAGAAPPGVVIAHVPATTRVFRSTDRGAIWSKVASIEPAFWSGLFVHTGR